MRSSLIKLIGNFIGMEGLKGLCEMLKVNKALSALDLRCKIGKMIKWNHSYDYLHRQPNKQRVSTISEWYVED